MCDNFHKEVSKEVKPSIAPKSAPVSWRRQHPFVREKLKYMLKGSYLHDVTFLVGKLEEKISCHTFMLIMSSDVFAAMFAGPLRPTDDDEPIKIPDVHPAAFRTLLTFIYTDSFDIVVEDALEVLYVAQKYDISTLVTQVVVFLQTSMSDKYAVSIYQAALLLDEPKLSDMAYNHITKNFSTVALCNDFLNLNYCNLVKIVADDETNSHELGIFQGAMRWAAEECKRQELDATSENFRTVLYEVINLIRFTLMGAEDFALKVCPTKILSNEDQVRVFQNVVLSPFQRDGHPEFECYWIVFPRRNLVFLASFRENQHRSLLYDVASKITMGYYKAFKVNRPIIMTGFLLSPICREEYTEKVQITVRVGVENITIYSQSQNLIPFSQNLSCLKFNTPVPVQSNTLCNIDLQTSTVTYRICQCHKDALTVACSTMGEIIFSEIAGKLPLKEIHFSLQQ